jgi:hypothetical protein
MLISTDAYAAWKETLHILADADLMQEVRDSIKAL